MTLQQRYEAIQQQVAEACHEAGRSTDAVRIMGVSKTVGPDMVAQAIDAGITDFGENRPEQLVEKHDLYPQVRWHFIGNIQSRQLKYVVGRACCIHSLYKMEHADKINQLAAEQDIVQHVLLEINDGEDNKQGLQAADAWDALMHCLSLEHVQVDGLMIMAPQADDATVSDVFASLHSLRDDLVAQLQAAGYTDMPLSMLSMGMSNDFALAIAQGSTMVRVGRAIFSEDYHA